MAVLIDDSPITDEIGTTDDDVQHIVCCCGDQNLTLCGTRDDSPLEDGSWFEDEYTCSMCVDVLRTIGCYHCRRKSSDLCVHESAGKPCPHDNHL